MSISFTSMLCFQVDTYDSKLFVQYAYFYVYRNSYDYERFKIFLRLQESQAYVYYAVYSDFWLSILM